WSGNETNHRSSLIPHLEAMACLPLGSYEALERHIETFFEHLATDRLRETGLKWRKRRSEGRGQDGSNRLLHGRADVEPSKQRSYDFGLSFPGGRSRQPHGSVRTHSLLRQSNQDHPHSTMETTPESPL